MTPLPSLNHLLSLFISLYSVHSSLTNRRQASYLKEELSHTKSERDLLAKEVKALKEIIVTQNQTIDDLKVKKAHYKSLYLPLKSASTSTSSSLVDKKEKEE